MKKTVFIILKLVLCLTFSCDPANNFSNANDPSLSLEEEAVIGLRDYIHNFSSIPAGWLLIDLPDEGIIQLASGEHDIHANLLATTDDLFRIASIGKTFTAVIILQLMEEGKLTLDQSIDQFLSEDITAQIHVLDGQSYGHTITIRQLLNHTSGIDNYVELDWINTLVGNPSHFWSPDEIVQYTIDHGQAHFPPGNGYRYSDTNYVLLGLIAEHLLKMPLHQILRDRVLQPLEMNHTFLEAYETFPQDQLASGYFEDIDLKSWNTSSDWAAGGLVTTLSDLRTFMRALTQEKLLSSTSYQMMTNEMIPLSPSANYGLGIGRYQIGAAEVIGHGGQGFGFNAGMYYWPDKDVVVCLAINQQATTIESFELAVMDLIEKHY